MPPESSQPIPVPEDRALYTAGLLNASKCLHDYMRCAAASGEKIHAEHVRDFNIPWYLETKVATECTLADYCADIEQKLKAALLERGDTAATIRENSRVITHWAFNLLRPAISLHKKSRLGNESICTPDDVLMRARNVMRILAGNRNERPILASTPAHPLWHPHRGEIREMQGVPKCVLKANTGEYAFAKSLVGDSINIEKTTDSPMSHMARRAVPELFEPDYLHVMELAGTRRKTIRALLADQDVFTEELRDDVVGQIADMWLEINPTNAEVLDTLETELRGESGPDLLRGDARDVLIHYFGPLFPLHQENIAELQRRLPILGAVTLRSVLDNNDEDIRDCMSTLDLLLFMNERKYSRTIQLAVLACMARMPETTPAQVLSNV